MTQSSVSKQNKTFVNVTGITEMPEQQWMVQICQKWEISKRVIPRAKSERPGPKGQRLRLKAVVEPLGRKTRTPSRPARGWVNNFTPFWPLEKLSHEQSQLWIKRFSLGFWVGKRVMHFCTQMRV